MKDITELENLQQQLNEELAVMIYFYNDDCPPCISLRPKVEKLVADNYPKMKLLWINSKNTPEIPAAYSVFANPAIILFFDGKETRRFSKYVSVDELEESIDRYYELIFG
jgi:thioredoxin-like negative regulator of GroEL